ncbi:class I SAM-dependent methyltransferase [Albidovulum sediminicola]|uniref:Class I SAM-dependent methyltransferase n=1 Tax=Albidovulum sediminicola TaxID=2984331 RepID=A0ABT2Z2L0_9RHOB|nr:class I SAM-dependent methyltransferase [Defluviimonas sp. WL0075]MCV2865346.1 class I SAM-dependent methyltransferase [Defluviimonas sp. WL0075]
MSAVEEQYEAYPYPERDPAEERKRLITGSPSHPLEIDHFLWGGVRDWSRPLRALVAGGGTGDALIQLAAVLTAAGKPYEITYLDLSRASRRIAEARAQARGLKGITFVTGSLLDAADHGAFDYIDCCGVLHHLPDPQAGFDALAAALKPDGGMGLMVYAPCGRFGVYPLQEAFGALTQGMTPKARLEMARAVYARLPEGHPFRRNPHLVDHEQGDAGFYDLLLHSQDRPFAIDALLACLERAGLAFAGAPMAVLYDPSRFLPEGARLPEDMGQADRMALAEKLDGTIKTHVVYAVPKGRTLAVAGATPQAVPHLKGVAGPDLARQVERKGELTVTRGATKVMVPVERAAAPLLALIDGRRSLAQIAQARGLDAFAFNALWKPVERRLTAQGLMLYSRLSA